MLRLCLLLFTASHPPPPQAFAHRQHPMAARTPPAANARPNGRLQPPGFIVLCKHPRPNRTQAAARCTPPKPDAALFRRPLARHEPGRRQYYLPARIGERSGNLNAPAGRSRRADSNRGRLNACTPSRFKLSNNHSNAALCRPSENMIQTAFYHSTCKEKT